MVLHRLTGSKEVINYLHKCNHAISYNDIRIQNQAWARMVAAKGTQFPHLRKGVVTHSTIDNNDGRQETVTGSGTTHDTNKTVFQIPNKNDLLIPTFGEQIERTFDIASLLEDMPIETAPYYFGKRVGPALFPNHTEGTGRELEYCFSRDIAWCAAGSLKGQQNGALEALGSWTAFNKQVSKYKPIKCVQEYLPITPAPPEYPICKEYLDFLLDMIEDLAIPHVFVHSDEAVYSKLCHILWKNTELYKDVILLMGGFHQLRVMQKIIYKKYHCRDMRQWCVDAGTIAKGSSEQAFEGRHYYRSMRVHKECFDALVQYRIEKITNGHMDIESNLMSSLSNLRQNPNPSSLEEVIKLDSFSSLVGKILEFKEGSEAHFTVSYLKDVSTLLSLVSAVREGHLERHLQAEKEMLCYTFAFDHQNYARYCSFQHVYIQDLRKTKPAAFNDLIDRGFGGCISGESFSTSHGDLIIEIFNGQTKGTAGPFRAGFSTDTEAVNKWVRTIHLHSELRQNFRKMLYTKTSSKHKEMTPGGKSMHSKHVEKLMTQITCYGIDPFSEENPKSFSTGVEIKKEVTGDMLKAKQLGSAQYETFLKERLVDGIKAFFDPIPRNKLRTGIRKKKKKKTPKAIEILKEDRQAFGLIVSKSVSMEEAFQHPITTVPLALATTESGLRQSDKASFRNLIIKESNSITEIAPKRCAWFVDGMAVIRTLKPRQTYKEFIDALMNFVTPKNELEPLTIGIINDTYIKDSVKEGTRQDRGEAGPRVHIQSVNQHMLQGMRWKQFLYNGDNKQELVAIIAKYLTTDVSTNFRCPVIVTANDNTYEINEYGVTTVFKCNHEEADYRLVFHAVRSDKDVVVVAKDTDVLILLVWAYNNFSIKHQWFMQYDTEKFANISMICTFLGEKLCRTLPLFHALSGCDTTSYLYNVGKVKVFNKLLKDPSRSDLLNALHEVEPLTERRIDDLKEFVRTVMYAGKKHDTYLETRIQLYQQRKEKSSITLPPDPDSLLQACKRAQFQTQIWLQCGKVTMRIPSPQDYGWIWDEEKKAMVPIWFTGAQLPICLTKKSRKGNKEATIEDEGIILPKLCMIIRGSIYILYE